MRAWAWHVGWIEDLRLMVVDTVAALDLDGLLLTVQVPLDISGVVPNRPNRVF